MCQLQGVHYSIRAAAAKAGLSPHTIRAWERRYAALDPGRTATNRRFYSEEDVEKLILLRAALARGHSIGQVASLELAELRRIAAGPEPGLKPVGETHAHAQEVFGQCEIALDRFDPEGLDLALTRGAALLSVPTLLDSVVAPLLETVGERWKAGTLRVSQEHMASAVLRTHLERVRQSIGAATFAPRVLVTTPARQLHEMGALLAATSAAAQGWHVLYLGPNLPADEVISAVRRSAVSLVALSVVYPLDDPKLADELARLRSGLGEVPIVVGGRAAPNYRIALNKIDASIIESLADFRGFLDSLRDLWRRQRLSGD